MVIIWDYNGTIIFIMGLYNNSGYNTNNSGYIWLYDGIIYRYNIPGWWFQPTPLKNHGVSNSWDGMNFPI